MFSGEMLHEDFKGHKGIIGEGGVQWMTAGKGIKHAEIPASKEVASIGTQLWINLPAKSKFVDPNYQEFKKDQILEVSLENLKGNNFCVELISSESACRKI